MEIERLTPVVKAVWHCDTRPADDAIENVSLGEARRWIAGKMADFNPDGPIRWHSGGRVCEAEQVWEDEITIGEPRESTLHIARAFGEIVPVRYG
jgi:hypothetical protein